VGQGHHAGGHRGRRPARGAARGAPEVPRVAGGSVAAGLGDGEDPELGHVGPADDHEARLPKPAHDDRVELGDEVAEQLRSCGQALPGDRGLVLDRDRDPRVRTLVPWLHPSGGLERALCVDEHERVELAVERLDPLKRRLDQLARRDLAPADHRGQLGRRPVGELDHGGEP
jgi:hypothetical protein